MFDRFFAPPIKKVSSHSNLYEMISNLKKRVEQLEEENIEINKKITNIQPVVYNITGKDQLTK